MENYKNYRIGNLVKHDNRIFKIDSIAKEFPTLDTYEFGIGVVDWNNIEPIKLTEEWILKLGFKIYNEIDLRYSKKDLFIEHRQRTFIGKKFFTHSIRGNTFRIDYVHQLQNLYHSIYYEDLYFKL